MSSEKQNNRLERATAVFTQYMKEHRCRKTSERYAVLPAAFQYGAPFSVDDLHQWRLRDIPISRVTVYNNLELLVHVGLILKHPLQSGAVQYEVCFENTLHHHAICSMCGQVFSFSDSSIDQFVLAKKMARFRPVNCVVNVYGICIKCQKKMNRAKRKQNTKQ